jgi:hypothetical protein
MPAELIVTGSGSPASLAELQDDWYQDVIPANLGPLLQAGAEWLGSLTEGRSVRVSLSGREIYVLAPHDQINGFVSTPRLVLGQEHVVLCTTGRIAKVRAAIELTGSPVPRLLTTEAGVPDGWVAFRGVVPRHPVEPSPGGDILDSLRPLCDIEIAFAGGIRIYRQTWLEGFPPAIRLRGDARQISSLLIDGLEASLTKEASYIVPGWDSPGSHTVWCTSASRTYSISSGAEQWTPWDAYVWSHGEHGVESARARPAICGVLVRPPKARQIGARTVVVPSTNPVLIGAEPGQISICSSRLDVRAAACVGFPSFDAVWAIPLDPIRCEKQSNTVLAIGLLRPPPSAKKCAAIGRYDKYSKAHRAWCDAILNAGRKGLRTDPADPGVADLWKAYRKVARALRKALR